MQRVGNQRKKEGISNPRKDCTDELKTIKIKTFVFGRADLYIKSWRFKTSIQVLRSTCAFALFPYSLTGTEITLHFTYPFDPCLSQA